MKQLKLNRIKKLFSTALINVVNIKLNKDKQVVLNVSSEEESLELELSLSDSSDYFNSTMIEGVISQNMFITPEQTELDSLRYTIYDYLNDRWIRLQIIEDELEIIKADDVDCLNTLAKYLNRIKTEDVTIEDFYPMVSEDKDCSSVKSTMGTKSLEAVIIDDLMFKETLKYLVHYVEDSIDIMLPELNVCLSISRKVIKGFNYYSFKLVSLTQSDVEIANELPRLVNLAVEENIVKKTIKLSFKFECYGDNEIIRKQIYLGV